MFERFPLSVDSPSYFNNIETSEVVFHAINKSGSLSLESAIIEAFNFAGRSSEYLSHYQVHGSYESFYERVKIKHSRFVVGHNLWGRSAQIPGLQPRENRIWITQFRHPLPRFLSCHNWLKNINESAGKSFPSLKQFAIKTGGVSFTLVEQFGGNWTKFKKDGETERTAESCYKASIDALEKHFHSLTIAEKFEESLFLVGRLCGLPSLAPWVRDNRNPGRKLFNEISDDERDTVNSILYFDYQLYDYALKRFEKQITQIDFGNNLDDYRKVCLGQYKDRILL